MVMFKARFKPLAAPRPATRVRQQQQQQQQGQKQLHEPQPVPPHAPPPSQVPPIEDERGPQNPVREPEPRHEPERVA